MENITLEDLRELEKGLLKKQCDLDIQKAMVQHFIRNKEEALTLGDVSHHVCFAPKRILPCSYENNRVCKHPGFCNFKDKKQIVN